MQPYYGKDLSLSLGIVCWRYDFWIVNFWRLDFWRFKAGIHTRGIDQRPTNPLLLWMLVSISPNAQLRKPNSRKPGCLTFCTDSWALWPEDLSIDHPTIPYDMTRWQVFSRRGGQLLKYLSFENHSLSPGIMARLCLLFSLREKKVLPGSRELLRL